MEKNIAVVSVPMSLDIDELHSQKMFLCKVVADEKIIPEDKNACEGLLSLLDHIQDYLVDECGYKEDDIFFGHGRG